MPAQRRGAIAAPVEVTDIRVLTRDDLKVLAQPRPHITIQTLRDTHHRLARAVAMGLSNAEVAAVTGLSIGRINVLRQDPAFKELVAHKRAMIDAEWAVEADPVLSYMRDNALKAQAMLSDKLDSAMEKDEFLPTRDLLGIAELGLDRTGYGKVNKNVNINVDFAKQLEDARRRSTTLRDSREPRALEGVATSRQPHAPSPKFEIEATSTQPQSAPGVSALALPSGRSVPSPPLAATQPKPPVLRRL